MLVVQYASPTKIGSQLQDADSPSSIAFLLNVNSPNIIPGGSHSRPNMRNVIHVASNTPIPRGTIAEPVTEHPWVYR